MSGYELHFILPKRAKRDRNRLISLLAGRWLGELSGAQAAVDPG